MNSERYAIYFAPTQGSPLDRFGAHWLGRDAWTGETLPQPEAAGLPLFDLTASPRLYGFHATLKPPMRLHADTTPAQLRDHLARFAAERRPFYSSRLQTGRLGGFAALVLAGPCVKFAQLAADCVVDFDRYRAPSTEAEIAHRKSKPLTARQLELIDLWGYPYVLDEWKFHMSMTRSTTPEAAEQARLVLEPMAEPFTRDPLLVGGVSLFHQPAPDQPFRILQQFPFPGDPS